MLNTVPPTRTSKHNTFPVNKQKSRRLDKLKPLLLAEIRLRYSKAEYFTRDHLLDVNCVKQFSMSYRMKLISDVISYYVEKKKLVKYSYTDIAVATPENSRKAKKLLAQPILTYTGSYTTRAADELLSKQIPVDTFDVKWLSDWLECLHKLAQGTRINYSRRIISDLVRRGVLNESAGFRYSVNY